MSSQESRSVRITCPQCGGSMKVPRSQAGQRYGCPRCGAAIIAPADPPRERPEAAAGETSGTKPPANPPADPRVPAQRPSDPPPARRGLAGSADSPPPLADAALPPSHEDEYGISCKVCGTRLHVRPAQVGSTIQCPDCYSPVEVTAPPPRRAAKPPAAHSKPPVSGPTAMQVAAQAMLDKARAEQEKEEAEERERSPDRFTEDLLIFFAEPQALIRLAGLTLWFELAMVLWRWGLSVRISAGGAALLGEASSMVAVVGLGLVLLSFLFAAAGCGWAVVRDTSEGRVKIERWPGVNVPEWAAGAFYIINASLLAAIPGIAAGILLALIGIGGTILFTAAASHAALFPPILLSMIQAGSPLAPAGGEPWESMRQRPDPWKLTYLITAVLTIGGVFGLVFSLTTGLLISLIAAAVMVTCGMLYFRTVGRLFSHLTGREMQPATGR